VLKLLQKSYAGRVKLIYIDPPYNTGKDFVYPDDFRDTVGNYLRLTGQSGDGGGKVTSNPETSGRFHTDWLNMMYPRLKLARDLLRDDGAIFISIDDVEAPRLRTILDEVFGEENFVANVVWQKRYAVSNDDPGISATHDHIIVYRKSQSFVRGLLKRSEKQKDRYTNPDNDPRGPWASGEYVSGKSKAERPTLWYSIKHPKTGENVWPDENAVWRYAQETHIEIEREGRLYWGPTLNYQLPRIKRYLAEMPDGVVPPTLWLHTEVGHNDEAQKETVALIGPKSFTTPKPVRLLNRILEVGAGKDDIVLDFFAGSGSFGHATLSANASDNGRRKFILVQIPERIEHQKYGTISDITKERLRRAGAKVKSENPLFTGDTGFRVFKLDRSNIRAWDPNTKDVATSLLDSVNHLISGRTDQDVLYEVLLKQGLDLCVPIQEQFLVGHRIWCIGGGVLFVCLSDKIDRPAAEAIADGIAKWHKNLCPAADTRLIFKDSGFLDDVAKTNLTAILGQHGLKDVRSI
jgi:adenine-specific DNA-methyltransferase